MSSVRSLKVSRGRRSGMLNTMTILSASARLQSSVAVESKQRQVMSRVRGLGLFPVSKMLKGGDNCDTMSSNDAILFWGVMIFQVSSPSAGYVAQFKDSTPSRR